MSELLLWFDSADGNANFQFELGFWYNFAMLSIFTNGWF